MKRRQELRAEALRAGGACECSRRDRSRARLSEIPSTIFHRHDASQELLSIREQSFDAEAVYADRFSFRLRLPELSTETLEAGGQRLQISELID